MLEGLQRRNYSQTTVTSYIKTVADFAKYFHRPPDQLGTDEIRTYQLYLLNERKQGVQTIRNHIAALRFFSAKRSSGTTRSKKCRIREHHASCRSFSRRKKQSDSSIRPAIFSTAPC